MRASCLVLGLLVAVAAPIWGPFLLVRVLGSSDFLSGLASLFGVGTRTLATGVAFFAGTTITGVSLRRVPAQIDVSLPTLVWKRDWAAMASVVTAFAAYSLLLWRVSSAKAGIADLFLFGAVLALFGFGLHRLGEESRPPAFAFSPRDWLLAAGVGAGTVVLASIHLTHWTFTWVGDEGVFFDLAKAIANGTSLSPFKLTAVYQAQPALDSIYQGLVMRLIGRNVVGWRMAEVLLLAATVTLVYLLGRALMGRVPGLVAAVVLGSSQYLIAFTHIGYNNTHCLFWSVLAMLMLVLAWRTRRLVYVWATGCAVGMCLYTFMVALFIGPVIAVLLGLAFLRRPRWRQALAGLVMLGAFAVTIVPGLLSTPFPELQRILVFYSQREAAATRPLETHVLSTARSLTVFWHNSDWHGHYVASPLLDPITGLLVAIGLIAALADPRNGVGRVPLVWFVFGVVAVGWSAYTPSPSITRLLFVMPAAALLAGSATAALARTVSGQGGRARLAVSGGVALILLAVPAVNLRELLVVAPRSLDYSRQALALRVLQEHSTRRVLFVWDEVDHHLMNILARYPWLAGRYQFATLQALGWGLGMATPGKRPPIIVAYDRDVAMPLGKQLGKNYSRARVGAPNGRDNLTVFVPLPGARARPAAVYSGVFQLMFARQLLIPRVHGLDARPREAVIDAEGNVYVAAEGLNSVIVVSPDGKQRAAWSMDSHGQPLFQELFGILAAPDGTVYALDSRAASIVHLDRSGRVLGQPIRELGYSPRGFTLAPGGGFLVADTGDDRVVYVSRDGLKRRQIGGSGTDPGSFRQPTNIATTRAGDMVVLDSGNNRVERLAADGTPRAVWDFPCHQAISDCGQLAVDSGDHILIAHARGENRGELVIFDLDGRQLDRIPLPFTGWPAGVSIGPRGRLTVAFPSLNVVQLYEIEGDG